MPSAFKIISSVGALLLFLIVVSLAVDGKRIGGLAAALITAQPRAAVYASCIKEFDAAGDSSFTFQDALINSDGNPDGILTYKEEKQCGTAGCIYELCISNPDNSYSHVSFGYAAKEVHVEETMSNGMRDILLNNDPNLKMSWSGERYELNAN